MMTSKNKNLQKPNKIEPSKEVLNVKKSKEIEENRFYIYMALHAQTLFASLTKLLKTPLTSIMTVVVLAISIALASSFHVLLKNVEQLTGTLETSSDITLFLNDNVNDLMGRTLADQINEWPDVKQVDLITQSMALAEFKDYSGFGNALNALENNPLPTVLQIIPKNSLVKRESLEALLTRLKRLEEVDIAQMDMQWIQRLQSMMDLARQGMILLSAVLSFAVLFVMGNTIRLELEDRREEVLIAKLVGATHSFIQRPFLYTGFWFGLFAGAIAWVIVTVVMLILKAPMERLSELYDHTYEVLFLNFPESLILLAISSTLGVLGSWMVLHYQLKSIRLE